MMRTIILIAVVAALAQYIAMYHPMGEYSLGVFYATMVLATAWPVFRANCTSFAALYFFMACAYLVDEGTSWQFPVLVMASGTFAGLVIFIICNMHGSIANKYIGSILIFNSAVGFVQYFVQPLSPSAFAAVHNLITIVAWIWMANMAFDRHGSVGKYNKDKLFSLRGFGV